MLDPNIWHFTFKKKSSLSSFLIQGIEKKNVFPVFNSLMKFYFTKINLFHKYIFSRKIAIYGKTKNKLFVQKRNHPTWSRDQVWSRDQSAIFSCPNFTVFTHALACSRWSWTSVMSSDEKDSDKENVSIGSFYVEVTGDVITPQGDAVARNRCHYTWAWRCHFPVGKWRRKLSRFLTQPSHSFQDRVETHQWTRCEC